MASAEKQRTSTFSNSNGQEFFYRNWITDHKPKGIVQIVHGLNAHSGYYQNFASELNENYFEVYAIDLLGHGLSAGERYYIADYKEIIVNINLLLSIAKSTHPTVPMFLLGHCAGGVFASIYAVHHQLKLNGLIVESFIFPVSIPRFARTIIKFRSNIIPHSKLVRLKTEDFSRDKSVVGKMNNDPLLANEKLPAKTIQQLVLAAEYLQTEIPGIKLPLLILHGTADMVAKHCGSEYFMEHASSADK